MKMPIFIATLLSTSIVYGQLPPHLEGKINYPAITLHPFMGTVAVPPNSLAYDPTIEYKVVIDVYDKIADSTKLSFALIDAARTYNLNIANGVPKEKLKMVLVIHGGASEAFLNEQSFEKKYGMANPNIALIRAFKKLGIPMFVCGQSLAFKNVPFENMIPEVEIVLSAKTALITFDQRGYSYLNVNE